MRPYEKCPANIVEAFRAGRIEAALFALRQAGYSMGQAMRFLAASRGIEFYEAKRIVHFSAAWHDGWAERDAFYKGLESAVEELVAEIDRSGGAIEGDDQGPWPPDTKRTRK